MSISGRRPNERTERARRIGKGIGKGFLTGLEFLATAVSDGPKMERIEEIDRQIADLKQERDHLIAGLIEPGDLKVSDDYDPRWRKTEDEETEDKPLMDQYFGSPRLVQCKGRATTSRYHDAHPGCPYIESVHNPHEFTLRD